MRTSILLIALLLLIFAYIYFSRQKYIEIVEEKKEHFKNIIIHKYENLNL